MKRMPTLTMILYIALLLGCSDSKKPPSSIGAKTDATAASATQSKQTTEKSVSENKPVIERLPDMEEAIKAQGFHSVFAFRFQGCYLEGWVQLETDNEVKKVALNSRLDKFADSPERAGGAIVIAIREPIGESKKRECVVSYRFRGELNEKCGKEGLGHVTNRITGMVPTVRRYGERGGELGRESSGNLWSSSFPWQEGEHDPLKEDPNDWWELFRLWQITKEPAP